MNQVVENSNPPLRAQPALALATTTKATSTTSPLPLPQIVLIEDKASTPRDIARPAPEMPLPNQKSTKHEALEDGNEDELFNNAPPQQQPSTQQEEEQQKQQQRQQKAVEPTPLRPTNTSDNDNDNSNNNNNNNKTSATISTGNGTPAPTPPLPPPPAAGGEEGGNEGQADSGGAVPEQQQHHSEGHQPKLHHLTRHWLPPEDRGTSAIEHMGASSVKEAEQKIRGMSQKELRASFQKVYGTPTSSFNNNWLRRKLYEAVGANGGASTKRYRRVGRNDAAARKRELQRAAAAEAEAEAVETLAEIAAGPSCIGASDMAESSSR